MYYSSYCISQKHQDAFASAIGFFVIGFWLIGYSSSQDIPYHFFDVKDPLLWFFRVRVCVCVCVRWYILSIHSKEGVDFDDGEKQEMCTKQTRHRTLY